MRGACDALFVSVEGGLSFEVFLLGFNGQEPEVVGRHVVQAELLLQLLPGLREMLACRFLVKAETVEDRLRCQGLLREGDCPCAAHVWSGLLDRLKAPAAPREEVQGKIQTLQQRFTRLALLGRGADAPQRGSPPSTDASLIAAEVGSLLDALGFRLPYAGMKQASTQGDREIEDLRRISSDPGLGLLALSNGIKAVAALQQLLQSRYPCAMSNGGRQEELLQHAFGDPVNRGRISAGSLSPDTFETPAPSPLAHASKTQALPFLRADENQACFQPSHPCLEVAVGRAGLLAHSRTSASTGRLAAPDQPECVRADELDSWVDDVASSRWRSQILPPSKLQPPSSWQSILSSRASRWSHAASSNCSASPASHTSHASSRRRGSEPPGRKSDGSTPTPRAGSRDAYFDRLRAKATRAIASKSPDPGITEAVKRAQHRARRAQQQKAEKDAEDARARVGPTGELVPHATARLFKRRDERIQRFVQKQDTMAQGDPEMSRSCSAFVAMESPQPLPSPEPCP